MHEQLNHESSYAVICIITADQKAFHVTVMDIKIWKEKGSKICTWCIEGAMKQHDKVELKNTYL
jgi:hypothetical protein